jgi:hypothetical protein
LETLEDNVNRLEMENSRLIHKLTELEVEKEAWTKRELEYQV